MIVGENENNANNDRETVFSISNSFVNFINAKQERMEKNEEDKLLISMLGIVRLKSMANNLE